MKAKFIYSRVIHCEIWKPLSCYRGMGKKRVNKQIEYSHISEKISIQQADIYYYPQGPTEPRIHVVSPTEPDIHTPYAANKIKRAI